jgi:hypothetical protein
MLSSYSAATASDLINDINAANAAGGANTITLTAPTTSPYILTAVNNTSDGPTGLPVIAKKDRLTIVGSGDTIERSTASGTPDFRLLDVASGAALTLENLTLQNGLAFGSGSASEGGAIYSQDTLVLSAVTVQDNIAQGSNGVTKGGQGTPGNPGAGGGIWSHGSLTLENDTLVENNRSLGGTGGSGSQPPSGGIGGDASGGGLYVACGTVTLTGVSINNNLAWAGQGGRGYGVDGYIVAAPGNAFGGGVCVVTGAVNLSSDSVDGNQAAENNSAETSPAYCYGGGVYVGGGNVTLSNDAVNGNFAGGLPGLKLSFDARDAYGGGICVAAGTVTLSNDTVQNNVATGLDFALGAGVYIAPKATVYIDAFTVAHVISNTRWDQYLPSPTVDNIDGPYTQT